MTPRIPKTDSINELAEFWDTHDLGDFAGELEEVSERVFERLPPNVVAVPLSDEERSAIRMIAELRGVEEVALIREWLRERLHQR